MLLHDEAFTGAPATGSSERHYNAEWALSAQLEVLARQFDEMEDDYLRERKADLEQVVERVLGRWRGQVRRAARSPRATSPARTLVLVARHRAGRHDPVQAQRVPGFITDVGGKTSHTAIVARSMDIPAVVGTRRRG
jgi:phosphotransferase system enzyme I (PtsI)